jgi:hypothetical protein
VYVHLLGSRVVWAGRDEDRDDDSVWAVTCFVTRTGFRRRGISAALALRDADRFPRALTGPGCPPDSRHPGPVILPRAAYR